MDAKAKFEQFIKKKRLRHSVQRKHIVDMFLATERHVSIQELFEVVRKKYKATGYATVARALKLLTEAGICRQVDFGDGIHRFEHKYGHEHHDHLICTECGRFVEIYSKALERRQKEMVKRYGYVEKYHKLDIFGICSRCQKKVSGRKVKKG